MEKIHAIAAIAAGLLAVLSAQQSYAQYGDTGSTGISEQTLQKCRDLGIDRIQCSESNVLLRERLNLIDKGGSGTPFLAEAGQMAVLVGVLGALFGGIAGAFFLMGRGKQIKTV